MLQTAISVSFMFMSDRVMAVITVSVQELQVRVPSAISKSSSRIFRFAWRTPRHNGDNAPICIVHCF